jgi:lipoprotein-anchoring transpeptidase ErfK/SrfK
VAVLTGAIAIFASTLDDGEAAAGTPAATRLTKVKQAAPVRMHTLKKTVPTKRPRSPFADAPEGSGVGRRIVYCISCQQVWLVEEDEYVFSSYAVSGRRGFPRTGTYKVIRKVHPGMSHELRLPYFVGFTFGNTTDVGFHGIPVRPNGTQIQSDSQLGSYRSSGCVRQNQTDARRLWDFAPMGTKVVVIP